MYPMSGVQLLQYDPGEHVLHYRKVVFIRKKCFDGVDLDHFCIACSTPVSMGRYVVSGSSCATTWKLISHLAEVVYRCYVVLRC